MIWFEKNWMLPAKPFHNLVSWEVDNIQEPTRKAPGLGWSMGGCPNEQHILGIIYPNINEQLILGHLAVTI